jgi:endonuclease YncB( thermonuclease family)
MGGEARLEQRPVQEPAEPMITSPRVNGALVLREVIILDGLRFAADGKVIALAGITSVPSGSECRRLDGVVESCIVRAANRLEVLTKGRPVMCDVKESDGRFRGVCRAGKIDLAEDLVRNGLAVRTSDGR